MALYSDNLVKGDSIAANIHLIDFNILSKLEQDLEPQEIISLVFLLYDESHVALQQVKLFERAARSTVPAHGARPTMDLLLKWAVKVQSSKPMWRYELLEALSICQLYSNIRKLLFDVSEVKKHFVPGNIHLNVYAHPIKKVMYKVCEGLTLSKLQKFKLCLETFNINLDDVNIAEIILLQLICEKFISLGCCESLNETNLKKQQFCNIDNLSNILKRIGCNEFALDLWDVQNRIIGGASRESASSDEKVIEETEEVVDVQSLESHFAKLLEEEVSNIPQKIKTDAMSQSNDAYKIKDVNNVGICYIINQVEFYPSKESIQQGIERLEDRKGSDKDTKVLKHTFTKFGFTVFIDNNLKHGIIKERIRQVISKNITDKHSIFVLCILSHGIKGAIFGYDSVPLKVSEIQDTLYGDMSPELIGIPKILLIQACQGTERAKAVMKWETDGPRAKERSVPTKCDLLTYWATVPDNLSYRSENVGSVFIQAICKLLQKNNGKDHLQDVFTKVNNWITGYFRKQVPVFESTLRKKIYLIERHA